MSSRSSRLFMCQRARAPAPNNANPNTSNIIGSFKSETSASFYPAQTAHALLFTEIVPCNHRFRAHGGPTVLYLPVKYGWTVRTKPQAPRSLQLRLSSSFVAGRVCESQ